MLSTNNLKIIVHDVFEEMKEEIDAQYKEKVWSSLDEDLKLKIRETLKNGLTASDMQVNYSYHKAHYVLVLTLLFWYPEKKN